MEHRQAAGVQLQQQPSRVSDRLRASALAGQLQRAVLGVQRQVPPRQQPHHHDRRLGRALRQELRQAHRARRCCIGCALYILVALFMNQSVISRYENLIQDGLAVPLDVLVGLKWYSSAANQRLSICPCHVYPILRTSWQRDGRLWIVKIYMSREDTERPSRPGGDDDRGLHSAPC